MAGKSARPLGVTIISVLFIILGLINLVGSISPLAIAGIVGGLIYLLIGFGIWSGWKIMWYLGVLFSILGAIVALYYLVTGDFLYIVDLLIEVIILWYLFRPNVKSFFGL